MQKLPRLSRDTDGQTAFQLYIVDLYYKYAGKLKLMQTISVD